jgi:hypothetical protein
MDLKERCLKKLVSSLRLVKPISVWTFFKNSGKTQVIGITFLARVISGKIRLGKEHTDFKWISA